MLTFHATSNEPTFILIFLPPTCKHIELQKMFDIFHDHVNIVFFFYIEQKKERSELSSNSIVFW